MELLDNLDWTTYTLRVIATAFCDEPEETFIYVHTEHTFGGDDPKNVCEECSMEQDQEEAEKHYEKYGVFPEVPHVPGMRYWYSMEVSQDHDWPHQDNTYCGKHMRQMLVQAPESGNILRHYNVPPALRP